MKPNFALNLSFEGIGLLYRAASGWLLVGEVPLDSADLEGELSELRGKAKALAPLGIKTKLVIPGEQIKYLTLGAPDGHDAIEQAVRDALEGATPYAIDDLVYDWAVRDGTVHVAAVARDTLDEAETFAQEHRFNPFTFVAIPDPGQYPGEPFFGPTAHALDALDDAGRIERDDEAIRIDGDAHLPAPEEPGEDTAPVAVVAPEQDAAPGADAEAETETEAATEAPAASPPEAPPEPEAPEEPAAAAPTDRAGEPDAPPAPTPDSAPRAVTPSPGGQQDAADTALTFSSIRAQRDSGPGQAAPRLAGASRQEPLVAATRAAPEVTGVAESTLPAADAQALAASLRPDPEDRIVPPPLPEAAAATPAPGASGTAALNERQRMTIFGARDAEGARRKPRFLGLILTAILLLFLIGVAAWASIFLDAGLARFFSPGREAPQIADVPPVAPEGDSAADAGTGWPADALPLTDRPATTDPPRAEPAPPAEDMPEDMPAVERAASDADTADGTVIASLPPAAETALPPGDAPGTAAAPSALPAPADLSPDEARARYAATGIWQLAPTPPREPGTDSADDVYQTSIDPAVTVQDAIALPDPAAMRSDRRPPAPMPPAAPGTSFAFDDRGLVIADEDGAVTPQGIPVYAGSPSLRPPETPDRPEAATLADPGVAPAASDPALAAIRPRPRPDDLSERNERGNLSGRTRVELAALRPRPRPQRVQDVAAATPAAEEAADETDVQATAQAVAASLKPLTRPKNLTQSATAQRDGRQNGQAETVTAAAARATPDIPTTASVATRATERNALRLRRVNLIGVYGTPSSRRALVRLSDGRYRKVQVGDRLDGGRVSAIGNDQLLYTKGGRSVVLQMPKG